VAIVAGLAALLPARAVIAQTAATQSISQSANLTAPEASQADRDEAARQLLANGQPDATLTLLAALRDGGHDTQLAVARAVADSPAPDPQFVEPLANLLGGDRNLDEAATRALGRLGSASPAARQQLLDFARDARQTPGLRALGIHAAAAIVDKSVAAALVGLATDDRESATIQNAAVDALADLTGLTDMPRTGAAWKSWYDANAAKPDDRWKLMVYATRDPHLDEIAQRQARLVGGLYAVLNDAYQAAADKNAAVLRYLASAEPEVRAVGARLVRESFLSGVALPTDAQKQRLTELIGDSDSQVRVEVAQTLKTINYSGALDAMMAQLPLERDPDVKIALAGALAQIGDIRAVPLLRPLLNDPSPAVARAAAEALRALGAALYKADPNAAHALAVQLWQLYQRQAGDPATADLQAACIEALAPLHESSLAQPLVRLLDPDQSDRVRSAALRALGGLGDPNTDDAINKLLTEEPEPSVRLDALDALAKTGSFGTDADALYGFFSPKSNEQDPQVRDKAWQVFEALLPSASKEVLSDWEKRLAHEPEHRLAVLLVLNGKYQQDHNLDDLASTEENTGDTYTKLNPPDEAQAARYFRRALDYWQSQNADNVTTDSLVSELMNALLKSGQYADAAKFAGVTISRSPAQQQTMGSLIVQQADALREAAQTNSDAAARADALRLIDEAMKMKPPLLDSYQDDLRNIQSQLLQKPPPQ
jgi:HEAT repeat protein